MIAVMKKIFLAGRLHDRNLVLATLQNAGVVHVEPAAEHPKADSGELTRELFRAQRTVENLSALTPREGTFPPPGTPTRIVEEFHTIAARLTELENETGKMREEINRVEPWGRISREDLELLRQRGLEVRFFCCNQDQYDVMNADLKQIIKDRDGQLFVLGVSKTPIQIPSGVAEIKQPEHDSHELRAAIKAHQEEVVQLNGRLCDLSARNTELREYLADLQDRKRFSDVEARLVDEGPVFILTGWIPEASIPRLEAVFSTEKMGVACHFEDVADSDAPPTKMENPWWCRPIEWMFKFLGITPGYREADISPFFFPFLAIFTAMLIGDAGYAFTALIALGITYSTLQKKGVPDNLLQLVLTLLAGTAVYGIFVNSWFGTAPKALNIFGFDPASPSGEESLKLFCFLLGSVHITIAHVWKIRRNPITLATLSEVGWIIFIWAMRDLVNLLVIGGKNYSTLPFYTIPMFYISLTMVTLFTAPPMDIKDWPKQGPLGIFLGILNWIGQGLGAIALNAAAFLSDIISYIRLWAVGLAGAILGASFNELAQSLPFIFMVIVLLGAHLMNFSLAIVAILAHGVRLNLLEFSNHLGMEWSGREYDPFRKSGKE